MNALRHGLRARGFRACCPRRIRPSGRSIWPTCAATSAPADATEDKLVTALAVAMWNEIRADRTEAGVLTAMPLDGARGRDLKDARNRLSLGTAIRYASAAGMATQRAQRAFLAHRKAKQQGLILPVAASAAECTNDFAALGARDRKIARTISRRRAAARPDPLTTLRARIKRLLDGTEPPDAVQRDLAAAILAVRLPSAAPYQGVVDLQRLDDALVPLQFDASTLAWLAGLVRSNSTVSALRTWAA